MEGSKLAQTRILPLLEDLSPESLSVVEQFVRFIRETAREGRRLELVPSASVKAPYLYPTVPVPASVFSSLSGSMPPFGGNALSDTEALYGDE